MELFAEPTKRFANDEIGPSFTLAGRSNKDVTKRVPTERSATDIGCCFAALLTGKKYAKAEAIPRPRHALENSSSAEAMRLLKNKIWNSCSKISCLNPRAQKQAEFSGAAREFSS